MDPYSDFAISRVQPASTIIGSGPAIGTTIVLGSGDGVAFPGGDGITQFDITVFRTGFPDRNTSEQIRVYRTGDTLTTVERGRGITSPITTIAAGWTVIAPVTASLLTQLGTRRHAASLRGYGTSLLVCDAGHILIVGDRWLSKLAQALDAGIEMNYGVSGSKLLATSSGVLTGWAITWSHQADRLPITAGSAPNDVRPPSQPLIALHYGINDAGQYAVVGSFPNFQATYYQTLEAAVRMLRGGFSWRNTDSRFTYLGGGWNAIASGNSRGGTAQATTGNGKSVLFTSGAATFIGGKMTFYPLVRPDSGETWVCQAKVDGGAYVTTVDVTSGFGISGQQTPVPIVVDVPAGSHTVQLDFSSVGAGGFYFLGATLAAQWPPLVMVIGQPTLPTMPPGSWPNLTQATLNGINASHAQIAAAFPDGKVRYVDLSPMNSPGFPDTNWADDLHYSPKGHSRIVELVLDELDRAGGITPGFTAGTVRDFSGKPDWSGVPGSMCSDSSTPKLWICQSITTGDWKGTVLA